MDDALSLLGSANSVKRRSAFANAPQTQSSAPVNFCPAQMNTSPSGVEGFPGTYARQRPLGRWVRGAPHDEVVGRAHANCG